MYFSSSIVIYDTNEVDLNKAIESLLSNKLMGLLVIVDNGKSSEISFNDRRIKYIKNEKNIGYGAAQNKAIKYLIKHHSFKYHIFCNPDVYFDESVITESYDFLEKNCDVGILGPKIIFPDGRLYPSAKLLPSAITQFCRYFITSFSNFFLYELEDYKYNAELNVPFICGAFSIVRYEIFSEVGFFDERFFLYQEDIDFSRRVHKKYKTTLYPKITINHKLARDSHKKLKMTIYHIISIIRFYNKWGWVLDMERKKINKKCIEELKNINLKKEE